MQTHKCSLSLLLLLLLLLFFSPVHYQLTSINPTDYVGHYWNTVFKTNSSKKKGGGKGNSRRTSVLVKEPHFTYWKQSI